MLFCAFDGSDHVEHHYVGFTEKSKICGIHRLLQNRSISQVLWRYPYYVGRRTHWNITILENAERESACMCLYSVSNELD